jgi:hypothetical protein
MVLDRGDRHDTVGRITLVGARASGSDVAPRGVAGRDEPMSTRADDSAAVELEVPTHDSNPLPSGLAHDEVAKRERPSLDIDAAIARSLDGEPRPLN